MNALQDFIASKPFGFIKSTDMPALIKLDRLCPLLVRCGGCRFTCAAQDADKLMGAIIAAGDYVRDVSFPVGSIERAANWRSDCPVTPLTMLPASFTAACKATKQVRHIGDYHAWFNESDCGGVFDGYSVTSDADPGL